MAVFLNNFSQITNNNYQYDLNLDDNILGISQVEFKESTKAKININCYNISHKTIFIKIVDVQKIDLNLNINLQDSALINCILYLKSVPISNYQININNNCHLNAQLTFTIIQLEYGETNVNLSSGLNGDSSLVIINSLVVANNKANSNLQLINTANANKTKSKIISRNILEDKSHLIFNGNPIVLLNKKNNESFLEQKTLLLSADAKIITVPHLTIANNEVKAGHSATVSTFASEDLFYLKTKGLNTLQANQLLLSGFIEEIINSISNLTLQKQLLKELSNKFLMN